MALDLYVGTLTRYLMRDWENKAQSLAREQGIQHIIVGLPDEPPPLRDEANELVVAWRTSRSQYLKEHLNEPLDSRAVQVLGREPFIPNDLEGVPTLSLAVGPYPVLLEFQGNPLLGLFLGTHSDVSNYMHLKYLPLR